MRQNFNNLHELIERTDNQEKILVFYYSGTELRAGLISMDQEFPIHNLAEGFSHLKNPEIGDLENFEFVIQQVLEAFNKSNDDL